MTSCRRCTVCEGLDHHWLPDVDDETGEMVMVCKHCEATRPFTDTDFDTDDFDPFDPDLEAKDDPDLSNDFRRENPREDT